MAAGQQNEIGFVIQARMNSTRLPGKVLLPIPLNGSKPIIQWIVDELKKSRFMNEIIVATSVNIENDILIKYCYDNHINSFRGSENDVLNRFISATKGNFFKAVVRLTADNPILDIAILDRLIQFHLEENNDYTYTDGLPTGMNLEIIDYKVLHSLEDKAISNEDKEHVTLFIRNSGDYKKGVFKYESTKELRGLRLTIDYPSDFLLLSTLLSKVNEKCGPGIELVSNALKEYPWLFEANMANIQKLQFRTVSEELKAAIALLERVEMKSSADVLRSKIN